MGNEPWKIFQTLAGVLTQIGNRRRIQIIRMNLSFWSGLNDWLRQTLVAEAAINEEDIEQFQAADVIINFYKDKDYELIGIEKEKQLEL